VPDQHGSWRSFLPIRSNGLNGLFEKLVAALSDACDRPRDRDGRLDTDAVMARAVVFEHFHARPRELLIKVSPIRVIYWGTPLEFPEEESR
jgi:hypothetical protein